MTVPEPAAYMYIDEPAGLDELTRRLAAVERVALDTEADSLHNYFQKVCLIQLSLEGEHYLLDPLAPLDCAGFFGALADKQLILHGADYDLRMLRASHGFRPRREVFDTMIAAQLLGIEQIGLAALIEKYFQTTLGKEGQKSDWSERPLSRRQLDYAVNDTRYLESLAERLGAELGARGRLEWLRESSRAMVESTGRDHERDPEAAWRIKGAGRLSRRQLGFLRELWRWRDEQARRADRPPFKVLGNQQLLELVHWAESHPGAPLQEGPKLPRNLVGKRFAALQQAVVRAEALGPTDWPELEKRVAVQPWVDAKEQVSALRAACAEIAARLELSPATLAPKAAAEGIARNRPRTVEGIMESGRLLRWQAELIQDAVLKVLGSGGSGES